MNTNQQSIQRRAFSISRLVTLGVIFLFGCSHAVLAQQWSTTGNDISNTNSGNVGVGTGTTAPAYKFDVLSAANILARFRTSAAAHSQVLFDAPTGYNANLTLQQGGNSQWYIGNRATDNRLSFMGATNNVDVFSILQNGSVGIGTTAPSVQFHLLNASTAQARIESSAAAAAALDFKNTSRRWVIGGGILAGGGDFSIYDANAAVTRMFFDTSGNVGIGTTSPTSTLDVAGQIRSSTGGFKFPDGSVQTTAAGGGGGVTSFIGRTGAVVAATNDYTWVQINKTTSSLADLTTRSAGDLSSGTLPDARFPTTLPAASGANLTALNASSLASGTVATARLGSGTADATTFLRGDNSWAAVTSSQWTTSGSNINYAAAGNVGIGTPTPASKLDVTGNAHVSGNLTVDGNIAAKYQDVAEWVPATHALPAGTVAVLNPNESNQVMASSQAYDTRVAGVISAEPGVMLGESGPNKVLVATTGRVRVKVDATHAPIRIGDLLVASDIEGMAMKSQPILIGGIEIHRPGTLIGKALEPLAKGQGEILALLSLQ